MAPSEQLKPSLFSGRGGLRFGGREKEAPTPSGQGQAGRPLRKGAVSRWAASASGPSSPGPQTGGGKGPVYRGLLTPAWLCRASREKTGYTPSSCRGGLADKGPRWVPGSRQAFGVG